MPRFLTLLAMAGCAILLTTLPATAQSPETAPQMEAVLAPEVSVIEPASPARPNFENAGALEAFIAGIVEAYRDKKKIAGVTISIVRGGEIVLARGYGIADVATGAPVSASDTLFRIGSVSKSFIWVALMQLEEAGKLSLDDAANDYLPPDVQIPDQGFAAPIRIRDLMSHTPGFEDAALGHLFALEAGDQPPLREYLATHRPHRVRAPGETAAYSNYGAGLAGLIVAQVSGLDFETYVESHITGPLGMTRTTFREPYDPAKVSGFAAPMPEELASRVSGGYDWKKGAWEDQGFEYIGHIGPAGAASSTATDMARLMLAHLGDGAHDGARIMSAETAGRMHQTAFAHADGLAGTAHGLMEYLLPGGYKGYGHGGATLWFHTNWIMVPELDLGIFISTNSANGRELASVLPSLIIERFFATPGELPAPPADFAERGQKYAGTYHANRRSFTQLEAIIALGNPGLAVSVTDDGYLVTTTPLGSKRFVETGDNLFAQVDGPDRIAFRENDAGEITTLLPKFGILVFERGSFFTSLGWFSMILLLTIVAMIGMLSGAWLRRRRQINQSRLEMLAGRGMWLAALCWLAFFTVFGAALGETASQGNKALFDFPNGTLVAALWLLLPTTALSVISLAGLYPVWSRRSWPAWRRIRHTLAVVIMFAFVLTLNHWNFIGFKYF
jgi:CubicO group peptidase (beta-lactamase class C family)